MSNTQALMCTLISAVCLSLGIPNEFFNLGSPLFGFFSLIPLYYAFSQKKSYLFSGVLGAVMMGLVHLLSSFWLANFKEFAIFTLGGSTMVNVVSGFLAGMIFRAVLSSPAHLRPVFFAAAFTVWEWYKSIGFLAYPWGTVVMSIATVAPLIQFVEYTGTWGISFLMSYFSAVIAEIGLYGIKNQAAKKNALFLVGVYGLVLVYGGITLFQANDTGETSLQVVMVQENTDSWALGSSEQSFLVSQRLTREAIEKSETQPDLIIWSESILPWTYSENRGYYHQFPRDDPFIPFLAELPAPLLTGAPVLVDPIRNGFSNSAILLDPQGTLIDWYPKTQLVPFAEYMPFTEYEWVRNTFDALVGFSSGWVPGNKRTKFTVYNANGIPISFATPICFEDAFSSVVAKLYGNDKNLLINLTNDSWSKTISAEYQHYAIASFRAIELRTTLIRSTNGGYSCVISPYGKILYDMPLFESASINVSVPIYNKPPTFYARFGDWFAILMLVITAVSICLYTKRP